jgi:hypothetical protein
MRAAASIDTENHSSAVSVVDSATLKVCGPSADGLKNPDHRIAKSCSVAISGAIRVRDNYDFIVGDGY